MRDNLKKMINTAARDAAIRKVCEAAPSSYTLGFEDGAEWALRTAGYNVD